MGGGSAAEAGHNDPARKPIRRDDDNHELHPTSTQPLSALRVADQLGRSNQLHRE
jgi:hypothetical protein